MKDLRKYFNYIFIVIYLIIAFKTLSDLGKDHNGPMGGLIVIFMIPLFSNWIFTIISLVLCLNKSKKFFYSLVPILILNLFIHYPLLLEDYKQAEPFLILYWSQLFVLILFFIIKYKIINEKLIKSLFWDKDI